MFTSPGLLDHAMPHAPNNGGQPWKQGWKKGERAILEPLVHEMKELAIGMKFSENPAAQLLELMFRTMVGINIPIGSDVIAWVLGNEFIQT